MESISAGCQLVPSLLYVVPAQSRRKIHRVHFPKAHARFPGQRTFPSGSCFLLRLFRLKAVGCSGIRLPGFRSGAAGIDIEALPLPLQDTVLINMGYIKAGFNTHPGSV